jgi:hypothetical protein
MSTSVLQSGVMKLKAMLVFGALLSATTVLADEGDVRPPILASGPSAQPQGRMNRITLGPGTLLVGAITMEYERALNERISVFAGPRITPWDGDIIQPTRGLALGGSAGVRFYESGRALSGTWSGVEVHANYQSSYRGSFGTEHNRTAVALYMVGDSYVAPSGFTLTVGCGAGVGVEDATSSQLRLGPVIPSVGFNFNLGWAF